MELNLVTTSEVMLREILNAVFSQISKVADRNRYISKFNDLLSDERLHESSLRQQYRMLTGIELPTYQT